MSNSLQDTDNFRPGKADNLSTSEDFRPESQVNGKQTLRQCVTTSLAEYFSKVDQENISDLYELVLSEVEGPLLESVMQQTRSNQSKASAMLGLNRGTLRKKLKKYGMLS